MYKDVSALEREYQKIRGSLHCTVTEEDYREIETRLRGIAHLAAIENRAISVYDIASRRFLLKRDDHISLLGYERDVEVDVDRYHDMIHPDDLPFLYDSEIQMYRYLEPIRNETKKDYKLVYEYRFRRKTGTYVRFLHQMVLWELDRNFNSWLILIISDVLSSHAENQKLRRYLINTATWEVHLFQEETGIRNRIVTPREKEVCDLLAQGLDSDEIADCLYISRSTVNNHRQNILRKTGSRNSTQALMFLRCIGIL